jgi:hypothetical protein
MCLSIAVDNPKSVLEEGEIDGFEYAITNNGMGYRCGYIRVEPGHPWHGKGYDDIDAEVHGGLTFSQADKPCKKEGLDTAWWVGFDCGHAFDGRDYDLPWDVRDGGEETKKILMDLDKKFAREDRFADLPVWMRETIKDTDYVRDQCKQLIAQAHAAYPRATA